MPTDTVALAVAGISGVVSLTAAIGVELLRRRGDRKIQSLKNEQDENLEKLRGAQAFALEQAKDELARGREAATKADEAARVVAKYRDPLLRSAYDLQSRIYNVYRPGGFGGGRDPEYFRLNTLFLFAEFLAWLEIIRREVQFLDLGAVQETKNLSRMLQEVQDQMSTTSRLRDNIYLYRGHQRAIGELMLVPREGQTTAGPRYECMGYAAFVAAQEDPAFAKWFTRLGDAIDRLRLDKRNRPQRLVRVQHALIDLIDLLDPNHDRFAQHRHRLPFQTNDLSPYSELRERVPERALQPRWSVKMGTDAGAQALVGMAPVAATVASLRALEAPAILPPDGRSSGAEETIWEVTATLVSYSLDDDLSYSLVLGDDSGHTMIAVIPDPADLPPGSFFADQITAARQAFVDHFNLQPNATPVSDVSTYVNITGIGFFEFRHGQAGIAPNGIELQPVLNISFPS
jgi:hypothetical protein